MATRRKPRSGNAPKSAPALSHAPPFGSRPDTRSWSDRPLLLGSAVFALALALRALYGFALRNSPLFTELLGDGIRYDAWAREIAAGAWIGSEVFYQAPLYPYFLAVVYSLAGTDPMGVRVVQSLLGASACVLLLFAGRRFFGPTPALVAALVLAAYPQALFYDGLIEKSSLDLWLMTLVLAAMAGFLPAQRWPWLLGIGVALGALTLNRENARVLVAVLVPWLLLAFRHAPFRRRLGWTALFLVAFAATLVPVAWRNHHVGGEWFVSTSQLGPNFYIGNRASARGLYDPLVPGRGDARVEQLDAIRLAEQATGQSLPPGEVSAYWLDLAVAEIRADPARWLRLLAWKLLLVFHATELTDSASPGAFATESPLLRGLGWGLGLGIVGPFAALGLWATRRSWRRLAVLHAMLAALAASVALFFVFARYRYPMLPILLLFAGAGLAALPALGRDLGVPGWGRRWLPGLAAAAVVAGLAHWPLPEGYRDDEITFFNVALGLEERGRRDDALAYMGRAIALQPRFGLAYFHRARWFAEQGRDAEAAAEYALAVRFAPEIPDTHYRYGLHLVHRTGKIDEGIAQLRRAVALLPDSAPARIELAMALAATGDSEAFEREARAALRLAPDAWVVGNNLAWLLATHPDARRRDGAEAVALAERAIQTGGSATPQLFDTLAAAYAEAGRFDAAIDAIDRALAAARAGGDETQVRVLSERRELFLAGRPFREAERSGPMPVSEAP